MHFSTIAALTLSMVAAPVLSAPLPMLVLPDRYFGIGPAHIPNLISRQDYATGSGASFWGDVAEGAVDVISGLFGDGSSSSSTTRRELMAELALRQVDASGASIWSDLGEGVGELIGQYFGGSGSSSSSSSKREPVGMLSRRQIDGSGASIWSDLGKGAGEIISQYVDDSGSSNDNSNRRELIKMELARRGYSPNNDALSIWDERVMKGAGGPVQYVPRSSGYRNRFLAALARRQGQGSGASIWGKVAEGAEGLVEGLMSGSDDDGDNDQY